MVIASWPVAQRACCVWAWAFCAAGFVGGQLFGQDRQLAQPAGNIVAPQEIVNRYAAAKKAVVARRPAGPMPAVVQAASELPLEAAPLTVENARPLALEPQPAEPMLREPMLIEAMPLALQSPQHPQQSASTPQLIENKLAPVVSPQPRFVENKLAPVASPQPQLIENKLAPVVSPQQPPLPARIPLVEDKLAPVAPPQPQLIENKLAPVVSPQQPPLPARIPLVEDKLAPVASPQPQLIENKLAPALSSQPQFIENKLAPVVKQESPRAAADSAKPENLAPIVPAWAMPRTGGRKSGIESQAGDRGQATANRNPQSANGTGGPAMTSGPFGNGQ